MCLHRYKQLNQYLYLALQNLFDAGGLMLFDFRDDKKEAVSLDGQEIDVFMDWGITSNLSVTPLLGLYKAKDGGNQLGSKKHNLYGQVLLTVSF